MKPKSRTYITSLPQLKALVKKMDKLEEFAYDTETNTLRVYGDSDHFRLVGISISWGVDDNYYIPTGHIEDDTPQIPVKTVARYLKPIFEKEDIRIIGWNLKFDMHVLARVGIHIKTKDLFDGMIASWLCNENEAKGLKDNTQRVLKVQQDKIDVVLAEVSKETKKKYGLKANNKPTFDLTRVDLAGQYAMDDAFYTYMLYIHYLTELEKENMEEIFFKTYPQFLTTLYRMEERGITIDLDKLEQMGKDMDNDLEELEYELLEIAGVQMELTSNQQLTQLLFGYSEGYKNPRNDILSVNFGFPVLNTTAKGAPQVNNNTLSKLAKKDYKNKRKQEGVKFCNLLLEYKKLQKLKTAFVDGLVDKAYPDGKCHPSFNPVGTDSGRISCSEPNLMQLPNASDEDKYQIRDCFIGDIDPKTGKRKHIISVDYSNLEVRVIAHFSKDPNLINAFLDGKDLHGNTAKMMFRLECDANEVKKLHPNLRQQGKVIAFLLQYGGGASTLYESLNGDGELDDIAKAECNDKKSDFYGCKKGIDVAQRLMDLYFEGFKGIAKFMKSQKKLAHRQGYIRTLVGRKRRLPEIHSDNFGQVSYAERLSINACIQGSGADIMVNAQNRIEGTNPHTMTKYYCEEYNCEPFIAHERLKELDCQMLVQIHDELLLECPEENCEEAINIIRDCMVYPFGENVHLNLPLDIGGGHGLSYQCGH